MKICHLTSAHPRYDTRIFVKECISLSSIYDVCLIVADGKGSEVKNNVNIYDVGKPTSRIKRMLETTQKVFKKAIEIDAQLYHFHDPELIPIGIKLLKKGKKVIFDIHEDVPLQLLNKPYLPLFVGKVLSFLYKKYEKKIGKKLSAVVCAEPLVSKRLVKINNNTENVYNFPKLEEFADIKDDWHQRKPEVCYIGSISTIRGIKEIVQMTIKANVKLNLAGTFVSKKLQKEISEMKCWKNVQYYGYVGRKEIVDILSKVKIGLVTLHPTPKYLEAYPVKMFEYMAAGVPIVASNFELYKQIINDAQCGLCVNPLAPFEIAKAVNELLADDNKLKQMSINGKRAVAQKYNWKIEEQKLLNLYKKILV